ncbi:MAG: NYN domain-containing protein [bacterium]
MMLGQRVAVFIDVQNMFYSAKHQYNRKIDFAKLLNFIVNGRNLTRAIAYVIQAGEVDQTSFLNFLKLNGFEVRSKELKVRPDGSSKGDWDMGMALDCLMLCDRVDIIALVTGDGDFSELVNALKARGSRVEVYGFPMNTSEELKKAATEFTALNSDVLLYEQ